jgi:hypothetical protein
MNSLKNIDWDEMNARRWFACNESVSSEGWGCGSVFGMNLGQ